MIHFMTELFKFEERAHMCKRETEECQIKVIVPIGANIAEDAVIERCILNELKWLWKQGIKTHCSCCGHGLAYNAFITVEKEYKDKMLELGYESPPDLLEVCDNCDVGVMFTPKSVLEEGAYE